MIERIIDRCAPQKFIVLIFAAAVLTIGIWTLRNQPVDAIPDLSDTQVIIYSR